MKAFVIKNKEGEYLEEGKDRYGEDTIIWHKDIVYADIYSSKGIAEMKLEPFYKDCEAVEITIAEGDLEQENKELKEQLEELKEDNEVLYALAHPAFDYEKKLKEYEEQLVEKDKEIEHLKAFMDKWHFENFEDFVNHYNHLMSLKNREQLMVENEAMKETIAELLGQKKTSAKIIRQQVCDEIREKLPYYKYSFQEPEVPRVDVIEIRDMEFILEQIEQAKEK